MAKAASIAALLNLTLEGLSCTMALPVWAAISQRAKSSQGHTLGMVVQTEAVRGHIDGLEHRGEAGWVLIGWAHDQANPDKLLKVEVVDGSKVLASGLTGGFREDVKNAGIGDGYCGLAIPLAPDLLGDRQEYDLALQVAGTGIAITPPTAIRKGAFIGYIDGYDDGILQGWALNPSDPTTPVAIDIMVDGQFFERVNADQPREDVAQQYGHERCGFIWTASAELGNGPPRHVVARVANTSVILPDVLAASNPTLGAGARVSGLSELSATLRNERRYRAFVDEYYRASKLLIEGTSAQAVIYAGHGAHEFASLLVRQFPRAYIGSVNRVMANPLNGVGDGIAILNIVHMDIEGFTARCLSGEANPFFQDRIQARQPTILIVAGTGPHRRVEDAGSKSRKAVVGEACANRANTVDGSLTGQYDHGLFFRSSRYRPRPQTL